MDYCNQVDDLCDRYFSERRALTGTFLNIVGFYVVVNFFSIWFLTGFARTIPG